MAAKQTPDEQEMSLGSLARLGHLYDIVEAEHSEASDGEHKAQVSQQQPSSRTRRNAMSQQPLLGAQSGLRRKSIPSILQGTVGGPRGPQISPAAAVSIGKKKGHHRRSSSACNSKDFSPEKLAEIVKTGKSDSMVPAAPARPVSQKQVSQKLDLRNPAQQIDELTPLMGKRSWWRRIGAPLVSYMVLCTLGFCNGVLNNAYSKGADNVHFYKVKDLSSFEIFMGVPWKTVALILALLFHRRWDVLQGMGASWKVWVGVPGALVCLCGSQMLGEVVPLIARDSWRNVAVNAWVVPLGVWYIWQLLRISLATKVTTDFRKNNVQTEGEL